MPPKCVRIVPGYTTNLRLGVRTRLVSVVCTTWFVWCTTPRNTCAPLGCILVQTKYTIWKRQYWHCSLDTTKQLIDCVRIHNQVGMALSEQLWLLLKAQANSGQNYYQKTGCVHNIYTSPSSAPFGFQFLATTLCRTQLRQCGTCSGSLMLSFHCELHTTSCTNRASFLSSSRAFVVGAISEPHHPEAGLDVKVWGMYDRS